MRAADRAARWLLGGSLAVLAATGLWLTFFYRPTTGGLDVGTAIGAVRLVHRLAWYPAVLAAVLLVALRNGRRWGVGVITVLGLLFGSFTGFLLPWDQLALRAVTVGSNVDGLRWLFSDRIRFLIVGGAEVSLTTYRTWAVVHIVVVSLVVGLAAVKLAAKPARADRVDAEGSEPVDQAPV